MARLPQPGSDQGTWGQILNDYLSVNHDAAGYVRVGSISETQLDSQVQAKLNTQASGVSSVNSRTGAVVLASSDVGLSNANNTSDANKPISTATQTALNAKADSTHTHTASQVSDSTATGRAVLTAVDAAAARTAIGAGSSSLVIGTTSTTAKAGDYTPTKSDVGLGNVDNTSDVNKPVSTATQTALNAKAADAAAVHNTGNETVAGVKTFSASPIVPTPSGGTEAANKSYVDGVASAGSPDATTTTKGIVKLAGDLGGTAALPTVPGLATKEASITAGTTGQYWRGDKSWQTLDKSAVGLSNVDNTSDANKPVSTATQTALNAKAPLASPTFTGTVTVPTPSNSTDAATKGYADSVAGGSVALTQLPAGITLTVMKPGGVWPARPTSRADIIVQWKGPDPSPAIVSSGTGGMMDNVDIRFVTP